MKANDRILKLHEHLTVRLEGEAYRQVSILLKKQDEISLRAGERKMVEWFRDKCPEEYGSLAPWSVFRAKLKELGINASIGGGKRQTQLVIIFPYFQKRMI